MRPKVFKTIDEQVNILKQKGLVINDEDYVKNVLLRENYFFINGFRHLFIKSPIEKTFIPNTDFRELYAMFNFDRQLRNIIFKNLLIFENNIKSIVAYVLSKHYGNIEKDYLSMKNFSQDPKKVKQINDLLKKMKRQIRINGGQHSATMHYMDNYGFVPLWIVVKILSFGIVSEFYSILKNEDKQEIAEVFKIQPELLEDYLPILANYRNLCAHEDICYAHRTQKRILPTVYHSKLCIPKMNDEYIYGLNDLFALVIILKQVLSEEKFTGMMNELNYEIEVLKGKLKVIDISKVLDQMGFPLNYLEIVRM